MSGLKWRDGKDVTFYWQYEAAPVVDVTPYIIVDNQRISPVGWFPQPGSAADEREGREEQTFGIVDRITISREAWEKSRRCEVHSGNDLTTSNDLPNQPPVATRPLLAYLPKKLS